MKPITPILRSKRQEAILEAAERLFADQGFHAVTLRQIAEAARVPLALVGYYFGRKNELFHAIFAHRRHWHQACAAGLDEALHRAADPARDPRSLQRTVEALALPLLQLRQQPDTAAYARLLAREWLLGTDEAEHPLRENLDPLARRFTQALQAAAPQASPAALAWACQFTLGAIGLHLRDERIERLSAGRAQPHDPAAAPRLVGFVLGGLQAALCAGDGASEAQPLRA